MFGPTKAFLGSLGMGEPKDNVYRTPEGTFALDQAFGRQANPGTKMPYFQATRQDWWDSNMKSPTYNTHVRQANSPGGDSENLYDAGPVYDYAVNIAHNPQRTPGKASAMFLHVTNGEPTMGCVAIDRDVMHKILRVARPRQAPQDHHRRQRRRPHGRRAVNHRAVGNDAEDSRAERAGSVRHPGRQGVERSVDATGQPHPDSARDQIAPRGQ